MQRPLQRLWHARHSRSVRRHWLRLPLSLTTAPSTAPSSTRVVASANGGAPISNGARAKGAAAAVASAGEVSLIAAKALEAALEAEDADVGVGSADEMDGGLSDLPADAAGALAGALGMPTLWA